MKFKIVITTSDKYLHIFPVFLFLFNKYWGQAFDLVGYKEPAYVPPHCTFHSMGEQRGPKFFSDDLIKYFSQQDDHIIWLMEDTFLRDHVNYQRLGELMDLMNNHANIGRISLSCDSITHYTETFGQLIDAVIYQTPPDSDYRLSTQPAIWNKKYLLKWLLPDHTPWEFENLKGTLMQKPDHEFVNLALDKFNAPIKHNEGVRKRDLYAFDLNGIDKNVIAEMKQLNII